MTRAELITHLEGMIAGSQEILDNFPTEVETAIVMRKDIVAMREAIRLIRIVPEISTPMQYKGPRNGH